MSDSGLARLKIKLNKMEIKAVATHAARLTVAVNEIIVKIFMSAGLSSLSELPSIISDNNIQNRVNAQNGILNAIDNNINLIVSKDMKSLCLKMYRFNRPGAVQQMEINEVDKALVGFNCVKSIIIRQQ